MTLVVYVLYLQLLITTNTDKNMKANALKKTGKQFDTRDKALYIINTTKNVGKSLEYALSVLEWYSNTDAEDVELRRLINIYW